MATVTQASELLMTAEEFGRRPDPGYPEELVRGRIEKVSPPPRARHGQVCSEVNRVLGNYVRQEGLGHVLSNDSGVITDAVPTRFAALMLLSIPMPSSPKGRCHRPTLMCLPT